MRLVLDASCNGETYLVVVSETPRGYEVSVHDSGDLVIYSSFWSDDINSFMLSSIPRECREILASKLERVLGEYKGEVEDNPLEELLENAIRVLKSL